MTPLIAICVKQHVIVNNLIAMTTFNSPLHTQSTKHIIAPKTI